MSQQTASYSTRPPMWGLASMCGGEIDRRIQAARSGQVKKRWVSDADPTRFRESGVRCSSRRVFGALRRASKNVSQIARDRLWVELGCPPGRVFRAGSINDVSRNTYE